MNRIIQLSVKRPVTVIMFILAVLLAGFFAITRIPLDKLPEISYPRVTVETLYPGMGATDVRSIITIPIEDTLSSVKGLERMRSVSRDGSSIIVLDFRWGLNSNAISVLVREAIDAVYPGLPEGIRKPVVVPSGSNQEAHAIIAIRSNTGDDGFARNLAEYELRARFRRIDGVAGVVLVGGSVPEAKVQLDIPRTLPRGIGASEFAQILSPEIIDVPAGNAQEGEMDLVVINAARPESVYELSKLVLPGGTGALHISDIASVTEGAAKKSSIFVFNGNEQVALELYRRSGANPVAVSREINTTLAEVQQLFSRDADIQLVYDSSREILQAIRELGRTALLGAVAVIGVLIFFIHRVRYSLLAAFSIPFSAMVSMISLVLADRSLNSMSLSGIALGIGLVSDTSVIVLDLLHRYLDKSPHKPSPELVGNCVATISASSLASTITTIVVFLPIIFLPGPLGALFGDMSIALISSVSAGWLYSQFCLPSLYRVFHKTGKKQTAKQTLEKKYRCVLRLILRKPVYVFSFAIIISIAGGLLLLSRPAGFVAADAATELLVTMEFSPGTDLEYVAQDAVSVSQIIQGLESIETVFGRAGAEDKDVSQRADVDYRKERFGFRCLLKKGVSPEAARDELRRHFDNNVSSKSKILVSFPQDKMERLLGLSSAYTIAVKGASRNELENRVSNVMAYLNNNAEGTLADYSFRPSGLRPELRVMPDREAASLLGVSTLQIAQTLQASTEGVIAGQLEIEGRPLDIRVSGKLAENYPVPEMMVESIPVMASQGTPVFLGTVARVQRSDSDAEVARLDRSDVMYLDLYPAMDTQTEFSTFTANLMQYGQGLSRSDESSFNRYRTSLIITVVLVIILLYMTLGAQFESFILPAIFMSTIPFSLAGAGPALLLINTGLDSGSVLGLVVLFGLVVNNGIVLYEITEERVRTGASIAHAVYAGASDRVRAVLATTLTTLFGLLPVLLSPLGATQRSMAAAMLGGMAVSTLLTLFVMPSIFLRFSGKEKP
jgi:multidrug efflux pump subunit AcrB